MGIDIAPPMPPKSLASKDLASKQKKKHSNLFSFLKKDISLQSEETKQSSVPDSTNLRKKLGLDTSSSVSVAHLHAQLQHEADAFADDLSKQYDAEQGEDGPSMVSEDLVTSATRPKVPDFSKKEDFASSEVIKESDPVHEEEHLDIHKEVREIPVGSESQVPDFLLDDTIKSSVNDASVENSPADDSSWTEHNSDDSSSSADDTSNSEFLKDGSSHEDNSDSSNSEFSQEVPDNIDPQPSNDFTSESFDSDSSAESLDDSSSDDSKDFISENSNSDFASEESLDISNNANTNLETTDVDATFDIGTNTNEAISNSDLDKSQDDSLINETPTGNVESKGVLEDTTLPNESVKESSVETSLIEDPVDEIPLEVESNSKNPTVTDVALDYSSKDDFSSKIDFSSEEPSQDVSSDSNFSKDDSDLGINKTSNEDDLSDKVPDFDSSDSLDSSIKPVNEALLDDSNTDAFAKELSDVSSSLDDDANMSNDALPDEFSSSLPTADLEPSSNLDNSLSDEVLYSSDLDSQDDSSFSNEPSDIVSDSHVNDDGTFDFSTEVASPKVTHPTSKLFAPDVHSQNVSTNTPSSNLPDDLPVLQTFEKNSKPKKKGFFARLFGKKDEFPLVQESQDIKPSDFVPAAIPPVSNDVGLSSIDSFKPDSNNDLSEDISSSLPKDDISIAQESSVQTPVFTTNVEDNSFDSSTPLNSNDPYIESVQTKTKRASTLHGLIDSGKLDCLFEDKPQPILDGSAVDNKPIKEDSLPSDEVLFDSSISDEAAKNTSDIDFTTEPSLENKTLEQEPKQEPEVESKPVLEEKTLANETLAIKENLSEEKSTQSLGQEEPKETKVKEELKEEPPDSSIDYISSFAHDIDILITSAKDALEANDIHLAKQKYNEAKQLYSASELAENTRELIYVTLKKLYDQIHLKLLEKEAKSQLSE